MLVFQKYFFFVNPSLKLLKFHSNSHLPPPLVTLLMPTSAKTVNKTSKVQAFIPAPTLPKKNGVLNFQANDIVERYSVIVVIVRWIYNRSINTPYFTVKLQQFLFLKLHLSKQIK